MCSGCVVVSHWGCGEELDGKANFCIFVLDVEICLSKQSNDVQGQERH